MTTLISELKKEKRKAMQEELLRRNYNLLPILMKVYDKKFVSIGITARRYPLTKLVNRTEVLFLEELLELLSFRKIGGHLALSMCYTFCNQNVGHKDIFIRLINKDLQCDLTPRMLKRAFERGKNND